MPGLAMTWPTAHVRAAKGERMIAAALVLIWLAMLAAGRTCTGKAMRGVLVEAPARWFSRRTRGQLITLALIFTGTALVIGVMEHEGVMLMAMYSPEIVMALASIEFTMVDVIVATLLTATSLRLGMVRAWLGVRLLPRSRAPRTRRIRRVKPPANDDCDEGALPLAA